MNRKIEIKYIVSIFRQLNFISLDSKFTASASFPSNNEMKMNRL